MEARQRSRRATTRDASSRATRVQPPPRIKITDFLRAHAVVDELSGRTAKAVLAELCQPHANVVDPALALKALLEREKLGSTGIGEGLAIPHARIPGLPRIVATFGRSKAGVEFGAVDGERTQFFFALLTPELQGPEQALVTQTYGNLLARIAFIFERPGVRQAILAARAPRAIYQIIVHEDEVCRRRRNAH